MSLSLPSQALHWLATTLGMEPKILKRPIRPFTFTPWPTSPPCPGFCPTPQLPSSSLTFTHSLLCCSHSQPPLAPGPPILTFHSQPLHKLLCTQTTLYLVLPTSHFYGSLPIILQVSISCHFTQEVSINKKIKWNFLEYHSVLHLFCVFGNLIIVLILPLDHELSDGQDHICIIHHWIPSTLQNY